MGLRLVAVALGTLVLPLHGQAQEDSGTWVRLDLGRTYLNRSSEVGWGLRATAEFQTDVPSLRWAFGGAAGTADDAYLALLIRGVWNPWSHLRLSPVFDTQVQFFGEPEFAGLAWTGAAGLQFRVGPQARLSAIYQLGYHGREEGPTGFFLGIAIDRAAFQGNEDD